MKIPDSRESEKNLQEKLAFLKTLGVIARNFFSARIVRAVAPFVRKMFYFNGFTIVTVVFYFHLASWLTPFF